MAFQVPVLHRAALGAFQRPPGAFGQVGVKALEAPYLELQELAAHPVRDLACPEAFQERYQTAYLATAWALTCSDSDLAYRRVLAFPQASRGVAFQTSLVVAVRGTWVA